MCRPAGGPPGLRNFLNSKKSMILGAGRFGCYLAILPFRRTFGGAIAPLPVAALAAGPPLTPPDEELEELGAHAFGR